MRGTPSAAQTAGLEEMTGLVLQQQHVSAQQGKLNFWTIYDHPRDHPKDIVARRHEVPGGPTDNLIGGDLEFLRDVFRAAGLVCVCRSPTDDIKIVETWI